MSENWKRVMEENNKTNHIKDRLLDKAEVLFAEKGYNAVTVREIIAAADCNLASINYYFGNKKNLYLEVFRARWIPRARRVHKYFGELLGDQESSSLSEVVESLALTILPLKSAGITSRKISVIRTTTILLYAMSP